MYNNFKELNRIGYGSNFNRITIDKENNTIKKECINDYGLKKIKYEINFYKYLISNSIIFSFPKIYNFNENSYIMEYYDNYKPLYSIFNNFNSKKKNDIIQNINKSLSILHNFDKKKVSLEEYKYNLDIEISKKILERYNIVKDIVKKYNFIKKINNIEILDFEYILIEINKKINNTIKEKHNNDLYFVPLHGDCQFNN